jgi:purine-nucleoside phosphorylase
MIEKIKASAAYIQAKITQIPEFGIILGSGLGNLANDIELSVALDYGDIPHFPVSTVFGHKGRLLFGTLGGRQVVVMQGRFHYYEGYSMQEVTFPVRVMKMLGVQKLIVSNAAGGLNPEQELGDLMIIKDHINLFPENPLRGKNDESLGPRFPDMSQVYDLQMISTAKEVMHESGIKVQEGVYVGTAGPTFETPSEYRYMRIIGGDAVGMSTVPEVIVARHMNMDVFAISVITDLGVIGKIQEISHEEVVAAAKGAEPKMARVVSELIKRS